MQLSPNARKGAEWVQERYPEIRFTSGRRDIRDQARVMAANVARYGSGWLFATYKPSAIVRSLQRWHEEQEADIHREEIEEGFYQCLLECHTEQLNLLSKHLTGDAWDAAWPGDELGARISEDILANMPEDYQMTKLLNREGALRLIHVQFAPSVSV